MQIAHNLEALCNLGLREYVHYKLAIRKLRAPESTAVEPVHLSSKHSMHPLWCRPNTSDQQVFNQIFVMREYKSLDTLQNVGLVVDCGANVGYSSAYFLSKFPNSTVIAVEPDIATFSMLTRNLQPYGERVTMINSAVWSDCGDVAIDGDASIGVDAWARRVHRCGPDDAGRMIAVTIGDLLMTSGFKRISILKIDVEGAEAEIFAKNYDTWLDRVDNLVIELHGDRNREQFAGAIASQDFRVSQHGELTICRR